MKNTLKLWFSNNRNIVRLTRYVLLSILFLFIAWVIDVRFPALKNHIPDLLLLEVATSEMFLTSLSGVFLSITTFTFTTILTVLNIYNSNYSPRIIQNFVDKPIVLNVLGTFIGGFFYTIFSLIMLKQAKFETELATGTLGIIYALLSMVNFIRFIRGVLRDIKATTIIHDIYDQGSRLVQAEVDRRKNAGESVPEYQEDAPKIYAKQTGYLHSIDYQKLADLLGGVQGAFVIDRSIGEYVNQGQYLARLSAARMAHADEDQRKELYAKLAEAFVIYYQRNDREDYHNEISHLVEIAVRALSSGVADPETAIAVIEKLCTLLSTLFSAASKAVVVKQTDDLAIVQSSYTVNQELHLAFSQILHHAPAEPSVFYSLLEGVQVIYMRADHTLRKDIFAFWQDVYRLAEQSLSLRLDKDKLQQTKDRFTHSEDFANAEAMKAEE